MRWLTKKLHYAHFEQGGKTCYEIIIGRVRIRIGTYDTGIYLDPKSLW